MGNVISTYRMSNGDTITAEVLDTTTEKEVEHLRAAADAPVLSLGGKGGDPVFVFTAHIVSITMKEKP